MISLTVPVPPQFETAIGWSGETRWISVCWTSCGDCPWIDDGRSSMTGHPWGMLAWLRHPVVAPTVRGLDIGSSEQDGTQRLLLDRSERRMYVTDTAEARAVVCGQWPVEEPVELTPEQWEAVVEEVRLQLMSRQLPSMDEIVRQMNDHSQLVRDMLAWLDHRKYDTIW